MSEGIPFHYVRKRTECPRNGRDNALLRASGRANGPLETRNHKDKHTMLYTIAVILVVLWLLGLVTSTTMGGFIHILLVIAIVVILLRVISGRKPI